MCAAVKSYQKTTLGSLLGRSLRIAMSAKTPSIGQRVAYHISTVRCGLLFLAGYEAAKCSTI